MYCPNCGAELENDAQECPVCGYQLDDEYEHNDFSDINIKEVNVFEYEIVNLDDIESKEK